MLRRKLLDAADPQEAARAGWSSGGVSSHRKAAAADAADPAFRAAAARLASQLALAPKGTKDVLRRALLDAASPQVAARAGWSSGGASVGSTSNLGYRKPNKTPRQERESAQQAARYQRKKAAKAAHPQ